MRLEFSAKVKMEALARSNGLCEGRDCGAKLTIGKYHFDHVTPDALGGKPTLANCQVLCWACHRAKTSAHDVPKIAKADRQRAKHLVGRTRQPRSQFKRKLSGEVVRR